MVGKVADLVSFDIMRLRVETLFQLDAAGRIVAVNQTNGPPAPRLFLGRTQQGNVFRLRQDVPPDLASALAAILANEPVAGDLSQPPATLQELCELLETQAAVERVWQGPAFRFPERIEHPKGIVARIVEEVAVVRRWFPWLAEEVASGISESLPCTAVIDGQDAVSVCFCSRTSASASEAGVDTVEAFRGRGYATAAVAAWADAVRNLGRAPLYSTSWDNLASRAVTRRLGLIQYGVDLSLY